MAGAGSGSASDGSSLPLGGRWASAAVRAWRTGPAMSDEVEGSGGVGEQVGEALGWECPARSRRVEAKRCGLTLLSGDAPSPARPGCWLLRVRLRELHLHRVGEARQAGR